MTTNTEIKTMDDRIEAAHQATVTVADQLAMSRREVGELRAALSAANTRIEDLTIAANRCINDALGMGAQPAAVQPDSGRDAALMQNAELVHERLKDIRHLGPGTHASDLAKEALPCIRAIIAAMAAQQGEQAPAAK